MNMVLDVACASKMFYYDKDNPNVCYCDNRKCKEKLCDGRELKIDPDVICDFTRLPFPSSSYNVVVFDPPHLKHGGKNSWIIKKYGKLPKHDWQETIKKGFQECFRVLREGGVLV